MFTEVEQKRDFVKMEHDILEFWEKNHIDETYLQRNASSKKRFSFIDGPITANNPMGLHHAWGRSLKDTFQRYKNMQGYKQRFQNGFDCQGLWVEVEVEKELGFNSKKDILTYGMANFTNHCIERVKRFASVQTEQSKRLGMFMDWENSYYTMSETNNLYIWHFLKMCNEKGLLYKNKSATTWCPRCETGLSQHEQSDGYMTIEDTSVYVKFKLTGKKNEFLLAWTTTPWTLSANVMLAVNPEHQYVKATVGSDILYLAEQSARRLNIQDVKKIDIHELLGRSYEPLYPDIPAQKGVKHSIVEWKLVDPKEGTGVVHVAPGCGQEDFELGKELGANLTLSPLDESGHFREGYGELTGRYAHDVAEDVIAYLKETDALFKTEPISHSYPHCWRCKTKCLFRLEDNWFLDIDSMRSRLKSKALEASWKPSFVSKRMQDWLMNMGDWMISRKRFYGLSLPFYECLSCKTLTVIGSKEELKEKAVNPDKVDSLPSLHRPWIDEITIKCPSCGKEVHRIADVGDCWLDAGVVPFSTLQYLKDRSYWEQWFPADLVVEMVEQVRLWYYSQLVYGVFFEDKIPYKTVLNYGEVRDDKGERFSKSKVNYIPFDEAAEKAGSDVIRWMYAMQPAGSNMRFGWSLAEDARRRFYLLLWNSYCYLVTYARQFSFDPEKTEKTNTSSMLDSWLTAELNSVVVSVTQSMDTYDATGAARRLETFVTDLSTWYIRRSRDRFAKGDVHALSTLYETLKTLSILLAPIVPFISEEMMQNLRSDTDPKSVHLFDYPSRKELPGDTELITHMKTIRTLCALGQAARVSTHLRVRQPLSKAVVTGVKLSKSYLDILRDELNVREVSVSTQVPKGSMWTSQTDGKLTLYLNTEITEELKAAGLVRDIIRIIQQARKEKGLLVGELRSMTLTISSKDLQKAVSDNLQAIQTAVCASKFEIRDAETSTTDEYGISVTIDA